MARIAEAQGDLDRALDLLDEAQRVYVRSPNPYVQPIDAVETRVWVCQGRLAQALRWARERGLSVDGELSYLREFEHLTLARVLIARYKRDRLDSSLREAMALLERLEKGAEAGGRTGSLIEVLAPQRWRTRRRARFPAPSRRWNVP